MTNGRPDGKQPAERHRGPIVLRRQQAGTETGTTDQRLLDSSGSTEWLHTDPWRYVTIKSLERVIHEKIRSSASEQLEAACRAMPR
jgi:hypothetical protein